MTVRLILPCLALAIAFQSGCVSLSRKIPERMYYTISVEAPSLRAPESAPVLVVYPISAEAPYSHPEFVYRTGPDQWKTDFYHRFLTPPDKMISTAVEDWMAGSGLFSHVVGPGLLVESPFALDGSLEAIYGDYAVDPPEAVLRMRLVFTYRDPQKGQTVLSDRTYAAGQPLRDRTRAALVEGWTQAAEKLLAEAAADLRSSLPNE